MRNLMAGWINEETSSNDKSEPVYSVKNQDGSAQANLPGVSTTSFPLNCKNPNSSVTN